MSSSRDTDGKQAAEHAAQSKRLPHPFQSQSPARKAVAALVIPAFFGTLTGVLLGVSGTAYWVLSALALLGGYFAGLEHRGAMDGADRGLIGGATLGTFVLLAHGVSGMDPQAHLGETPGALVVIAAVIGAVIGAIGGSVRLGREQAGGHGRFRP